MLSYEGLYYAIGTIIASLIVGVLFSLLVVQAVASSFWFFTYHFVIWPMLVVYPFLILLTVIIPSILYRKFSKEALLKGCIKIDCMMVRSISKGLPDIVTEQAG